MVELFIAKRYLRAKHKLNLITIISFLSTLGIAIGVAALIIVLSVFNGFGSLVTSILISFDPHIRISVIDEKGFSKINELESSLKNISSIKTFYPYAEGKTIILNKRSYEIVTVKGIPASLKNEKWGIPTKIISGKFDLESKSNEDKIILSLPLALRLSARIGDTIYVTSAYNIEKTITTFTIPLTRKFIITGLFETNNRDYDVSYAFTSLKSAQRLFGLKNNYTGYEIRLDKIENSEKVKKELQNILHANLFSINTWYDLHKDLYSVMTIERWSAYILLSLIIAVATFNIFASLTMTVLEKKKDIGILRSIGLEKKSILKIFMFEGILVGIIGTILGLTIGLLICYLQIKYNFYPLDPEKYIINAMPVKIKFTDVIAVSLMSMFLSFIASLYPAKRAANTIIIDSIKYE
ncbi:ABC transporter permease [Rosettibacter firmus]|uniref:ABC transporter permease n=1 Tax=Rosettibacter firmus TaxID=3111522 RepID=UPI00336BDB7C